MTDALHIVCPHCHTTNRVRQADLANTPDCEGCHQALILDHSLALNEDHFDRNIARSTLPLLDVFLASWWCTCRHIAP